MADDPTIGWRLDRIEETLRDLGQRVISADLYAAHRAEMERDIADLRAQLAEEKLARQAAIEAERQARKEGDRDLKTEVTGQGSNWRQFVYAGVVPGLVLLAGILMQLKGGK
ncbi:hypothetical protein ACIBI3_02395 [Actinomadura luteofluorescens]|uniref:hypothetical protein n=1 Tax=Actinomadura luteofluorescens TaxID=46163 RepID=UPI00348A2C65